MNCPFLEEISVRYCKAFPVRKMIPKDNLNRPSPCEGKFSDCIAYQEFAQSAGPVPQMEAAMAGASAEEKKCIWMKAGVVAYRLCTSNYDCRNCEFDQMLADRSGTYGETPLVAQAIARLRAMPAEKRQCRYMLTGDVAYKLCANNYECYHCTTDQLITDMIETHPFFQKRRAQRMPKEEKVRGFAFRPDYYYDPAHVWLRLEKDGRVRVGLDDFARRLLGPVEEVRLPAPAPGERADIEYEVRSGTRWVKLGLPLPGRVVARNDELVAEPSRLDKGPHEQGWLFVLELTANLERSERLMRGAKARFWLEAEADRLRGAVKSEAGPTLTDGGDVLAASLPEGLWRTLIDTFLRG